MWGEIARFEIRYHLGQPLLWCAVVAFFAIALMVCSTDAIVVLSHAPPSVLRDSPVAILSLLAGLTSLGVFVATAFVASAALRDFRLATYPLFFTTPVRSRDYLLGRFAGSMVLAAAVFAATTLGCVAGRFAPWQEAHRLGSFAPVTYLYGFVVVVLPNLLVMGAVFFAAAILSRSLIATYAGVILFVGAQDIVETAASDVDSSWIGSVLEPLGLAALDATTRYWTIAELNSALPALTGVMLANRLAWLAVGAVALATGVACFSPSRAARRGWFRRVTRR